MIDFLYRKVSPVAGSKYAGTAGASTMSRYGAPMTGKAPHVVNAIGVLGPSVYRMSRGMGEAKKTQALNQIASGVGAKKKMMR